MSRPRKNPLRLSDGGAHTAEEQAIAALVSQMPSASPDDLSVERVWRRLASPAEAGVRRRVPRWIPAAGVALVAVAAGLWFVRPLAAARELTLSSGGVFAADSSGDWRTAQSGAALAVGEHLRTDATGHAMLRLRGVAAVVLGEDSDLLLEQVDHGTVLRLVRGMVTARVSKRKPDEPFVIRTDRYTVKVVGTLFSVQQDGDGQVSVSVREGVVEVASNDGSHLERVSAGSHWTSRAPTERTLDATPDAMRTLLESGLSGAPATELVGSFATVISSDVENDRLSALARTQAPTILPDLPALPPIAPKTAVAPAAHSAAIEQRPTSPPSVRSTSRRAERRDRFEPVSAKRPSTVPPARFAPATDPSPTPTTAPPQRSETRPPPAPAPPIVQAPPVVVQAPAAAPQAPAAVLPRVASYAHARELEAGGDYKAAADELAHAVESDGAHADLSLYALGRLAQRQLEDPRRALSAFQSYRDRFPRGALLPEVDLAILELEVARHDTAGALEESSHFLAVHPASERLDDVHLLRGNLLRDAGRYGEAIDDYAAVHAARFADDAVYQTAYCQAKLGQRTQAAQTLHQYLDRFPNGAHRKDAARVLAEDPEKVF